MEKLTWKTEKRTLKDLVPFKINPRTIKKSKLKELEEILDTWNVVEIPVINLDNTLITWNQRLKAMILLGRKDEEVDVRVPNRMLTEEEVKTLNPLLNTHAGQWDFLGLQENFMDVIENISFDIGNVKGFDFELKRKVKEDEFQPKEIETNIKVGDLIEFIGKDGLHHRLICGDSSNPETVKILMDGKVAKLMVTDPPYGVNYDPNWRTNSSLKSKIAATTLVKNDDNPYWLDAYKLFEGGVAYVWFASTLIDVPIGELRSLNYALKYIIVWNKDNAPISRGNYHYKHELCLYAVKKGFQHNWQGARDQSTVWDIKSRSSKSVIDAEGQTGHGTQKPVECMAIPIRNNSAKGELIYDPFIGSGTTMVAAHQLQRNCYAVELFPPHCQMIVNRMRDIDSTLEIKINSKPFEF